MVKSDSRWMKDAKKDDCEFDHGGCFSLKVQRRLCCTKTTEILGIFFALSASSDEEVADLIGCGKDEAKIHNILFVSIRDANEKCRALWRNRNGLLLAYTGRRRCDNGDNFRNERLELTSDLLEPESKVHIAHARKRISKAL
ncbi:DNA-directed RNA polymerases IV and V subunit 2, partial [Mucuna pruriens]